MAKLVGGNEDVVLEMKGVPGMKLTVLANSATFPDGSTTGMASVSQVHMDQVPMQPPNGSLPPLAGTLQPLGAKFDPPVRVQFPNVNGLPPGTVSEMFQFHHDTSRFVPIGKGTVTEDGRFIISDPGFGLPTGGWHLLVALFTLIANTSQCGECEALVGNICDPRPKRNAPCNGGIGGAENKCTTMGVCDGNGFCAGRKTKGGKIEGSGQDIQAFIDKLDQCDSKSMGLLSNICSSGGDKLEKIKFEIGRKMETEAGSGQKGVVIGDDHRTGKVDMEDLDAMDNPARRGPNCGLARDSCQTIIHFIQERINLQNGNDFNTAHNGATSKEKDYRNTINLNGKPIGTKFCTNSEPDSNINWSICTGYDLNGDLQPDFTEILKENKITRDFSMVCR